MDERKEMGGEEKEEEKKRKRLGQGKVWHSPCPLQDRPRLDSGEETENRAHSTWSQVIDTLKEFKISPWIYRTDLSPAEGTFQSSE